MSLFFIHQWVKHLFLGRKTENKIHRMKERYGNTTLREQARSEIMNRKIKKSKLYKMGQVEVLQDIDIILRGGTVS